MKITFLLCFLIIVTNCSNNGKKSVYWCGDHQCINKKERQAYFKKTMIVEVKELTKKNKISKSEFEKIKEQIKIKKKNKAREAKDLAKQKRVEEKNRIISEKLLVKQKKNEKKMKLKEQKILAKQKRLYDKNKTKSERILSKQTINNKKSKKVISKNKSSNSESTQITTTISDFDTLVKKIENKNMFKSYPDINRVPE